jgi:hypothetical protein
LLFDQACGAKVVIRYSWMLFAFSAVDRCVALYRFAGAIRTSVPNSQSSKLNDVRLYESLIALAAAVSHGYLPSWAGAGLTFNSEVGLKVSDTSPLSWYFISTEANSFPISDLLSDSISVRFTVSLLIRNVLTPTNFTLRSLLLG